jgi:hypothetical protein
VSGSLVFFSSFFFLSFFSFFGAFEPEHRVYLYPSLPFSPLPLSPPAFLYPMDCIHHQGTYDGALFLVNNLFGYFFSSFQLALEEVGVWPRVCYI